MTIHGGPNEKPPVARNQYCCDHQQRKGFSMSNCSLHVWKTSLPLHEHNEQKQAPDHPMGQNFKSFRWSQKYPEQWRQTPNRVGHNTKNGSPPQLRILGGGATHVTNLRHILGSEYAGSLVYRPVIIPYPSFNRRQSLHLRSHQHHLRNRDAR